MYLVDFDRTLFRTDDFYEYVRSLLSPTVSKEKWHLAYNDYQAQYGVMNIFSMIEIELGYSPEKVKNIRAMAADGAQAYLYPGTFELLAKLGETGDVQIFTYGDEEFQKYKLHAAGLGEYQRIISPTPKHTHPAVLEAVLCIDDRATELDSMADRNDTMQLVRVAHPNAKYGQANHTSSRIVMVSNLFEAIEKIPELEL